MLNVCLYCRHIGFMNNMFVKIYTLFAKKNKYNHFIKLKFYKLKIICF